MSRPQRPRPASGRPTWRKRATAQPGAQAEPELVIIRAARLPGALPLSMRSVVTMTSGHGPSRRKWRYFSAGVVSLHGWRKVRQPVISGLLHDCCIFAPHGEGDGVRDLASYHWLLETLE